MTEAEKYKMMFSFYSRWVTLNEDGLTVGKYLKQKNIHNVAIYGLGALGKHLLYEIKKESINIVYGIDKRSDKLNLQIPFLNWEDKALLPEVDMLIVTAIADYEMIEKEICEIREYPVISLEELITDMENYRSRLHA